MIGVDTSARDSGSEGQYEAMWVGAHGMRTTFRSHCEGNDICGRGVIASGHLAKGPLEKWDFYAVQKNQHGSSYTKFTSTRAGLQQGEIQPRKDV